MVGKTPTNVTWVTIAIYCYYYNYYNYFYLFICLFNIIMGNFTDNMRHNLPVYTLQMEYGNKKKSNKMTKWSYKSIKLYLIYLPISSVAQQLLGLCLALVPLGQYVSVFTSHNIHSHIASVFMIWYSAAQWVNIMFLLYKINCQRGFKTLKNKMKSEHVVHKHLLCSFPWLWTQLVFNIWHHFHS